jgi:hypothetical protein
MWQCWNANQTTVRKAVAFLDAYEQLWIARVDQMNDILTTTKGEPT